MIYLFFEGRMRRGTRLLIALLILGLGDLRGVAHAKDSFDPRPTVRTLISAFQNCGPPGAYQLLSPNLFQIVAFQTGGTGCYPSMAAAGLVSKLKVVEERDFPLGPLFIVRVSHPQYDVDWFVGFNRITSKVEYLSFQAASDDLPTISNGPTEDTGSNGPEPDTVKPVEPKANDDAGCKLYPAMCE